MCGAGKNGNEARQFDERGSPDAAAKLRSGHELRNRGLPDARAQRNDQRRPTVRAMYRQELDVATLTGANAAS